MRRQYLIPGLSILLALSVTACGAPEEEDGALGEAEELLLSASPAALDFGNVPVGTSKVGGFTLTNTSPTFTDDISTTSSSFHDYTIGTVVPCVRPTQSERILITFRPTGAGTRSGQIVINYTETSGIVTSRIVNVTGQGI